MSRVIHRKQALQTQFSDARWSAPALALAIMFGAAGLCGCDRDDSNGIRTYSVAKVLPVGRLPDADPGQSPAAATLPIHWTVPAGWSALPAKEMRFAAFAVSAEHPDVVVTVIPLGGGAGSLGDNVRRWQKQLNLPPTADEQLGSVVTHAGLADSAADMVNLTAPAADGKPAQAMLAAIVPNADRTWFFKLMGPADIVEPQATAFNSFIRSVQFDDGGAGQGASTEASSNESHSRSGRSATPATQASGVPAPGAPAPAEAAADTQSITYTAPPDWVRQGESNAFRAAAFDIHGADNQVAQVVVAKFNGPPGTLIDNVNRWRDQVGLTPITQLSDSPPTKATVGGSDAMQFQFEGPAGAGGAPAKAINSVLVVRGPTWWFFKLQGPAALVQAQRSAFAQFLKSVAFTGESH